jgi:L-serine/L-threonine ammonia-lyase
LRFSLDHRVLVEPACGASLSVVYNEELRNKYLNNYKKVIVLVCGGSGVSIELVNKWKDMFNI